MNPAPRDDRERPRVDRLVDEYFDGALDGRSLDSLERARRRDSQVRGELNGIAFAVSCLSSEPSARDLTGDILQRVERERPFVPEPTRRRVVAGRLVAAALALALVGGVVLFHRAFPGALTLRNKPEPLSAVVAAGASDARAGLDNLRSALTPVRAPFALSAPAPTADPAHRRPESLSLRDVTRVEPTPHAVAGFSGLGLKADDQRTSQESGAPRDRLVPVRVFLFSPGAGD